ncbi:SDR family NAD(P)-dependent oxidoreductase [Bacillus halotolerans]|uniref:SDR family NAD(P)-dependent oxidoreductase n=1 Tax=Bacillus halotolerans TaxID=260554 RepID=UPI00257353CF|nr:SDR family NAD(P)-dependent oxidoreductase [Bacillus halotolerans]MDL5612269.1 SDR family NAD(P)-dependent oxidoreductase [Bacillus halotolerans]
MPKQQTAELKPFFHNKTVLVTGGTGSIGSQIVKRLLLLTPKKIIVFSKDDSKQYVMSQKYAEDQRLSFILGDVRDHRRVNQVMTGVDIVFHAAALKQVPTCEDNPFEAIQTNLIGGQNVVEAALINGVQHVINISTDKAVFNDINYKYTKKERAILIFSEPFQTRIVRSPYKTLLCHHYPLFAR